MLSSVVAMAMLLRFTVMQAPAAAQTPAVSTAESARNFEGRVINFGGRIDYLFLDSHPFKEYARTNSTPYGAGRTSGAIRCQSSTLAETKAGNLLCAYQAGSDDKGPDAAIWISRFSQRDGWSEPELLQKIDSTPHWSPVLFRDPRRGIYLFFKVGRDIPVWQTYWCRSDDGGRSWTAPVELVGGDKGGRGPAKNKPIILADGAWLAAGSNERGDREQGAWKSFADRSEDDGKTWTRTAEFAADPAVVPGAGTIQPALWESKPNEVHALVRTSGGFIGRSDSHDGGRTWSAVAPAGLSNNNSSLDVLRMEDGRLFLVYNPARADGGSRSPLTLALSTDNGATWKDVARFEDGTGDFTFPTVIRLRNGIAVSYTWKRDRVRCWQIPVRALPAP